MARAILHLDLDAFYCAVEEQRDPTLKGKPFAVGGRPEARGVVASCSYAARHQGVRSAMPMSRAVRTCPGLLVVPPHFDLYRTASKNVMTRLHAVTPLVEQISIDEAFLEVTDLPETPETIARSLQQTILTELGLPCSLGIASNKLVAKIASDYGKSLAKTGGPPNAITVVPLGMEAEFLAPLPVDRLWGVGPMTAARLAEIAITTIGDLARASGTDLIRLFGKHGEEMSQHARGEDDRPIVTEHEAKSFSQEETFARDVGDLNRLHALIEEQAQSLARELQKHDLTATTVKLKIRWPDFTTHTRQITLNQPFDKADLITQTTWMLFEKIWEPGKRVRLLGVGVTGLTPRENEIKRPRQRMLWEEAER